MHTAKHNKWIRPRASIPRHNPHCIQRGRLETRQSVHGPAYFGLATRQTVHDCACDPCEPPSAPEIRPSARTSDNPAIHAATPCMGNQVPWVYGLAHQLNAYLPATMVVPRRQGNQCARQFHLKDLHLESPKPRGAFKHIDDIYHTPSAVPAVIEGLLALL